MKRASLASLLATAALALVPAAALAQDAGGGQYTDPLAGGGGGNNTPAAPAPTTTAQAPATSTASTSASKSSTSTKTAASADPALPRTGFPAGLLVFFGVISIGGGLALRRIAANPGV